MQKILLEDIPVKIDLQQLLAFFRIEANSDDAEEIQVLAAKAEEIGRPRALYREVYIDDRGEDFVKVEGITFHSRVLAVNVEKAHRLFAYVMTCGMELEQWSRSISDMLQQYWADRIKEMALACAGSYLEKHLQETRQPGHISTMNPGSLEDWPISEQKPLFELLGDTEGSIGVTLTESCLMIPSKTVSGIYFPTEADFQSCLLCPREGCPGRRAKYEPELFTQKYHP